MCYNILNEEEVPPRVRRIGGSPYDYAVRKESAKHQDRGMLLKDMAQDLDVTSSYLSAVEVGKRNVPEEWPRKIGKMYDLSDEEIENLEAAATASASQIKLDLSDATNESRELAVAFARRFNDLTPKDQNEILTLLKNRRPNT